jgi:O-antigen/teichoic acid export membrane protein
LIFGIILKDIPYRPYIVLAIGAAAFSGPIEVIKANFRIKEEAFQFVFFGLLQFFVNLCFTLYFVVVMNLGALGLIRAIFISNVLFGLISLILLMRESKSKISFFQIKEAILISTPIVFHMVSHWGLNLMDRLILQSFVSLSDIGLYQLGYQVGTIYQVFIIAINNAWVPFFFQKKGNKDYEKIIQKISSWLILFQLFIASLIILFKDEIFRVIINEKYYDARLIVPYVVIGFVFVTFYHMWVNILFFQKKMNLIPISTIFAVITNIVINILLIPKFGIIGSALATTLSYGVLASIVFIFSIKMDKFRFEYNKWFKVFISGSIIVFLSLQINYDNLYLSFFIKSFILLLWPINLSLMKFWDKEDLKYINKLGIKIQKLIYHLVRK